MAIRHYQKEWPGQFLNPQQYINLLESNFELCVFCGGQPTGFDRIDSAKTYSVENMQPACGTCNVMKMAKSDQDFIDHIAKIHNYRSSKEALTGLPT